MLGDLNKFYPNLRFTYENSKDKITEGRIIANLYCKPTDGHHYFHYGSCNADHIKKSIIFSQTLQLKRMCSEKNDLNVDLEDLKKWFRKRRYSHIKALRLTPSDENNSKIENDVSLVVIYNLTFKNLFQVIRKNLQLLYAIEEVKKGFSPVPFLSFRSIRKVIW